jgi:hypothetical protein
MYITGEGVSANNSYEPTSDIRTWICGHQQRNGEIGV